MLVAGMQGNGAHMSVVRKSREVNAYTLFDFFYLVLDYTL